MDRAKSYIGAALAAAISCAGAFNGAAAAELPLYQPMELSVFIANHINPYIGYHVTPAMGGESGGHFPRQRAASLYIKPGSAGAPYGYADMCKKTPAACVGDHLPVVEQKISLTAENWAALNAINTRINRNIRYVSDMRHYGAMERWQIPADGKGDCEDYVLAKQSAFIKAGFSPSALLMMVVENGNPKVEGEFYIASHALLLVRTTMGDYVMDNYHDRVMPLDAMKYQISEVQTPHDRSNWAETKIIPADHSTVFGDDKAKPSALIASGPRITSGLTPR